MTRVTAKQIQSLLALKYERDHVYLAECKDGPTLGTSHGRLDGWAMRRSWSKMAYLGFEIKVSRSDFLQDDKWPRYLGLCNQFYFVCAPGVIKPEECPEAAGLLVSTRNATKLYTKKKAPRREIEPPVELMQYALMRAQSFDRHWRATETREDRLSYWRKLLEQRKDAQGIGHAVSRTLRRRYEQDVKNVRRELASMQRRVERAEEFEEALKRAGVNVQTYSPDSEIRGLLEQGIPRRLDRAMTEIERGLENLRKEWRRAQHRAGLEVGT